MKNRISTIAAVAFFSFAYGCSSSGGTTEVLKTQQEKVIKGEASDSTQDAVILLVHYEPGSNGVGSCTGSLIAPNLVLTARHCVADTDESAACKADGTPIAEGAVRKNHPANSLYVFKGKNRPQFGGGEPKWDGRGAKILDDGGKSLCNHDIALVLLEKPVEGAQIAQIRLDGDITKGETFTAVGWGVTDKSQMPDVRQQRPGVEVIATGPSDRDQLPPNEFEVGESICSGDSGGPAFDADTGAIIGIVSRGGNMTQPDPNDPSATCIDGENFYTKLPPFKDFIMSGFQLAEADPWIEGGPDPRKLKTNEACTDPGDCRSNQCLADPSASDGSTTCAASCQDDSECEDGQKCVAGGDDHVCRAPAPPPKKEAGGVCSYSPASSSSSSTANGLLFALGAVLIGVARRRRRR